MISQDFLKQATGYGLTTAQILYRRPDHLWLLQTYSGRPTISAPNFPSCRAFWNSGRNRSKVSCIRSRSHILALSNRPRSNRWTGCSGCTDQRPASLAAASAPDGCISPAYPPPGKSSLCNQAPQGKGRHMNQVGLRRPMFLAGGCAYFLLPLNLFVAMVIASAAAFYADVFFHKSFKTITVSTRRRESWPRNWVGDADERHFLSAFGKKPGRQPGLLRTLKFGAGQFRRTG
jgi:uncharacterized protein Usg